LCSTGARDASNERKSHGEKRNRLALESKGRDNDEDDEIQQPAQKQPRRAEEEPEPAPPQTLPATPWMRNDCAMVTFLQIFQAHFERFPLLESIISNHPQLTTLMNIIALNGSDHRLWEETGRVLLFQHLNRSIYGRRQTREQYKIDCFADGSVLFEDMVGVLPGYGDASKSTAGYLPGFHFARQFQCSNPRCSSKHRIRTATHLQWDGLAESHFARTHLPISIQRFVELSTAPRVDEVEPELCECRDGAVVPVRVIASPPLRLLWLRLPGFEPQKRIADLDAQISLSSVSYRLVGVVYRTVSPTQHFLADLLVGKNTRHWYRYDSFRQGPQAVYVGTKPYMKTLTPNEYDLKPFISHLGYERM
jgi:hypothetical protein